MYSIKFYPLRGTHALELCVYGTGDGSQLLGTANPFVTEEDDSEEFFTPVRIQSGYLRIVDDGYNPASTTPFDWLRLLPESVTSRPVVLRNAEDTTDILWTGFIQQQQAENTLFEYPIERDYAVYDVLGASYYIDFNTGITGPTSAYVNFAFLIKRFADLLPAEVRPANYYIQDYDHAAQRLLCQVNPQLFHDVDVEARQNLADTPCHYTCGEVLEEIAKFWGFTIRSHGNALYFTQDFSAVGNGHSDFLKLTYSQLSTMAGGTSAGSRYYAPSEVGIGGSETSSTENYMAPAERYDETLVTADVGEHTDIVTIFDEMLETCLPSATFGRNGSNLIVASTQTDGYVFGGVRFNRPTFHLWQGNLYGLLNEDDPFNFATQMHYDYMAGDGLPADRVAAMMNYIKLEQLWPYCYSGCKMSMEATFFNTDGSLLNAPEENTDVWGPVGTKMLHMSIAFVSSSGTVYFNGSRWKTTDEGCYCRIGGSNKYIYPLFGSPRLPNLNPAVLRNRMPSRYIVMPDGTGRLVIKIYGAYSEVNIHNVSPKPVRPMSLGIGNFTAKVDRIVRDQLDAADSNEYYNGTRGKADRDVASVWSVDTIFASDNLNQFGIGTVLDGNGSPLTTLTIHNQEYRPEEWVSELAYTYYTKKRMVIDLDLRDDIYYVERISPARRFTFKGMLFHPVSISRQWHDSTARIIGMQVNTEGYRTYSVTPLAGTGIAAVSGGGHVYDGDPAQVSCYPSAGYAFRYWQDAQGNVLSYNQTYRIPQVTDNMTLTAVGVEDTRTFAVRVLKATGVQSVSGGGEYRVGTLVTIGCVLGSDYTFTAWQQDGPYGELVSLQQTFQLRVRQDITLYPMTAYAGTDVVFRIFFGVEQPDWGYIRDDNDIVYHNGDEYEMLDTEVRNFTAVPSIGYEFDKWMLDGEAYATKNPVTVTGEELLADQTLTAVFRKQTVVTEWTLTLRAVLRYTRITVRIDDYTPETFEFSNASDVFTVQVSAGAQVQLTASYTGFDVASFKWWEDADMPSEHETSLTLTFIMDKNKDITCVYE